MHGLLVYGWAVQKSRMSLVWMGWMATSNLVGAAIYAARVNIFKLHTVISLLIGGNRFLRGGHLGFSTFAAQVTRFSMLL